MNDQHTVTDPAGIPAHLTTPTTMQALIQETYGPPDILALAEVSVPVPGAGQVRVRVAASSVNARDWHVMRGEPRLARFLDRKVFGRAGPTVTVRGTDFSGTVEAVGPEASPWRIGDRVFGEAEAAWAAYVVADADQVAAVPSGTTLEQAAAVPLAGTTALVCLSAAQPVTGDRVLINGASGGVGTFAIQLAVAMGLRVTAVCSARNAAQAQALGAETVLDYALEDFCVSTERYDVVLDLVGNRSLRALRNLVLPSGTLVLSGGGVPGTGRYLGPLGLLMRAQVLRRLPGPRIVIPQAKPTTQLVEQLGAFMASESLVPVVDRVFDLAHGADAVRYVETEHASGKVVLTVRTSGPESSAA
jgi:NADPH:quinone reductase-like Zn-dependent oxidoreductase